MNADTTPAASTLDRQAVEARIAKDYPGLRLLLVRRTQDEALAADLLNEAILTTWEKWQAGKIAQPELICGYVFQVALNLLRNHQRSLGERRDRRADAEALEHLPGGVDPALVAVEGSIAQRVKGFLQELGTPRDRLILKRFYLDEEDKASICRDLKLETEHFDKVLHRARSRLKQLVEASGLGKSDFFCWALA